MAAGGLTPEAMMAAMQAVHKQGVNTDPGTGMPYPSGPGGGGAPGGAAPAGGAAPGAAPPDQAAQEQAVWNAFPSTDPNVTQQMAGGAGSQPDQLVGLLQQFMAQSEADQQKLS